MNRQQRISLSLSAALLSTILVSQGAFAKTAKECTEEWKADKVGMQARGTTEKAYVDQCRAGAAPAAAAPEPKPVVAAPTPATVAAPSAPAPAAQKPAPVTMTKPEPPA